MHTQALTLISHIIGLIGIIVMLWGVLLAVSRLIKAEYFGFVKKISEIKRQTERIFVRHDLGEYILLGLEFMIAGDIIDTLLKPDIDGLIILGSIVVIRTIISYFLNKELRPKNH